MARIVTVEAPPASRFRRGDPNADAQTDIADGVFILSHLFLGGDAPDCLDGADVNDSGDLDIADASYIFDYLFLGGAQPPEPFVDCGIDPTPDPIDCAAPACPQGEV